MSSSPIPVYSPALKMKRGELEGLRQLEPTIADYVLPPIIIPPPKERGQAGPLLLQLDNVPEIAAPLAGAWLRPALLDPSHIIDEFGREKLASWLPSMFERARRKGVIAIPLAPLKEITLAPQGFRACVAHDQETKFGVLVPSEDIEDSTFSAVLAKALHSLGLTPPECAVVVDFAGSELINPEIVAPIIRASLETLQDFGLWHRVIFQGSAYPSKNPAPDNGVSFCPRNEWLAWKQAVAFEPKTASNLMFGDYAADCSKIEFNGSQVKPIRHLRYTAGESWRIQRGTKTGTHAVCMHKVYAGIAYSSDFAGESFSIADAYIAEAAADPAAPQGGPTTWRQLNTTHHVTHVVHDIAKVRSLGLRRDAARRSVQTSLLLPSSVNEIAVP